MKQFVLRTLAGLGGLAVAAAALGAESDKSPLLDGIAFGRDQGPVTVSADSLDFDYRNRRLTYAGNVIAAQGATTLRSDGLTLTLSAGEPHRVETLVADGNVRLKQGEREAQADHAVFEDAKRTIVLDGHAVLRDGANHVSGERVTVFLDEQRSEVSGGRVNAVLYPDAKKSPTAPVPGDGSKEAP